MLYKIVPLVTYYTIHYSNCTFGPWSPTRLYFESFEEALKKKNELEMIS